MFFQKTFIFNNFLNEVFLINEKLQFKKDYCYFDDRLFSLAFYASLGIIIIVIFI